MKHPWENDSCEQVQAYYTVYHLSVAAALWCGIPPGEIGKHLEMSEEVSRGVFRHPFIPCLEPRCRAMHEGIENGALLVSRGTGVSFDNRDNHVAPERRHVSRQDMKAWIAKEFPADKPAFLFDEMERKTHSAINADTFRTLQADRDALSVRLEKAEGLAKRITVDRDALLGERDSLRAMVEKMGEPGQRAETTYLNIIGAMLGLMLGNSPGGQQYSIFRDQAAIISALLGHHHGTPGLSARTLEDKFAEAKRSLKAT